MSLPSTVPTTIERTPRIRLLLKLLSDHVGEWVPAREIADVGGSQYSVYIRELQAQGHVISERRERHGDQTFGWFRLNRRADGAVGLEEEGRRRKVG
jgi:hypothetical protein